MEAFNLVLPCRSSEMKAPGRQVPGDRLRKFSSVWRRFRASPEIVSMIKHGHKIDFVGYGPKLVKPDWRKATKLPPAQMTVIRAEVAKLVAKKAMRIVPLEEARSKRGFYSRLFCVPKPDGSWRPIINLKPMNRFVVKKSFKMETIKNVRQVLRPGMWAATVDLKDAYYHIGETEYAKQFCIFSSPCAGIHRKSRKYFRFIVDGVVYEFVALVGQHVQVVNFIAFSSLWVTQAVHGCLHGSPSSSQPSAGRRGSSSSCILTSKLCC